MLSISHGSNLKCTRLGRDTTNGLRSTWQIHSFHVSPKSPRLAQTHRLIRSGGLSPQRMDQGSQLQRHIQMSWIQCQIWIQMAWKNMSTQKQSEDLEKLKKTWLHTAPLMALLFCGIEQTAVSLPKAKP